MAWWGSSWGIKGDLSNKDGGRSPNDMDPNPAPKDDFSAESGDTLLLPPC